FGSVLMASGTDSIAADPAPARGIIASHPIVGTIGWGTFEFAAALRRSLRSHSIFIRIVAVHLVARLLIPSDAHGVLAGNLWRRLRRTVHHDPGHTVRRLRRSRDDRGTPGPLGKLSLAGSAHPLHQCRPGVLGVADISPHSADHGDVFLCEDADPDPQPGRLRLGSDLRRVGQGPAWRAASLG